MRRSCCEASCRTVVERSFSAAASPRSIATGPKVPLPPKPKPPPPMTEDADDDARDADEEEAAAEAEAEAEEEARDMMGEGVLR